MHYKLLVKDEVKDLSYLKLCVNKTHMGPVSEDKIAKAKAKQLSAAANKVRVLADFRVSVTQEATEVDSTKDNPNRSYLLFADSDLTSMEDQSRKAVYIMNGWDRLFSEAGTSDYMKKLEAHLRARSEAYARLGINPASGSKPVLSDEQRMIYNTVVGPTSFDYYEYHIAFKLQGVRSFVRTKTYRSFRPLDVSNLTQKLEMEISKELLQFRVLTKAQN